MGQVHARALSPARGSTTPTPAAAAARRRGRHRHRRPGAAGGASPTASRPSHPDWRELVARDDIDLVCVTGPNFLHRDVAVAAADAGKHLWVEKPAGRNAAETARDRRGGRARRRPVGGRLQLSQRAGGRAGQGARRRPDGSATVEHTSWCASCSDYAAHPDGALSWRFQNEFAGSGVLGDLVSHAADLVAHVVGRHRMAELVADTGDVHHRAARARPGCGVALRARRRRAARAGRERGLRLGAAALRRRVARHARVEPGRRRRAVHVRRSRCTAHRGALAWDFRRMGELQVCLDQDYQDAAYATLLVDARRRRARRLPAGGGHRDGLRRPQGHRGAPAACTRSPTGKPHGATIHDALIAARTVDAMIDVGRRTRVGHHVCGRSVMSVRVGRRRVPARWARPRAHPARRRPRRRGDAGLRHATPPARPRWSPSAGGGAPPTPRRR